jgi:hypothetical protein
MVYITTGYANGGCWSNTYEIRIVNSIEHREVKGYHEDSYIPLALNGLSFNQILPSGKLPSRGGKARRNVGGMDYIAIYPMPNSAAEMASLCADVMKALQGK